MKFSTLFKLSVVCIALSMTSTSLCALRATVLARSRFPNTVLSARTGGAQQVMPARMPARQSSWWSKEYYSWEYRYYTPCLIGGGIVGGTLGSLAGYTLASELGFAAGCPLGEKNAKVSKAIAGVAGFGAGGFAGSFFLGGPVGAVHYGVIAIAGASCAGSYKVIKACCIDNKVEDSAKPS